MSSCGGLLPIHLPHKIEKRNPCTQFGLLSSLTLLSPHNQGRKRMTPPTKKKGFFRRLCDKLFLANFSKKIAKLVKSLENHIFQKFPKKLSEKWKNLSKTNHCLQWNEKKSFKCFPCWQTLVFRTIIEGTRFRELLLCC